MTAYTEIKDILKARDAGATEFLAKPFSAKLVYYRLRSIIENPRNYVDSRKYFGPDRRRRKIDDISADRRTITYQYTSAKRKQPNRVSVH